MSGFGVAISSTICIILLIIFATGILSATLETFVTLDETFENNIRSQQEILHTRFEFYENVTAINHSIISLRIENTGMKRFSSSELMLFDLVIHYRTNSTTNRVVWIPYCNGDIAEEGWNYTFAGDYMNNPNSWDPSERIKITIQLRYPAASNSSNFLQFSSSNGVLTSTYFEATQN